MPGEEFGLQLREWLSEGAEAPPPPPPSEKKDNGKGDVEKGRDMIRKILEAKDRKFPLLGKAGIELMPQEWLKDFAGVDAVDDLDYEQAKKTYAELVRMEGGV